MDLKINLPNHKSHERIQSRIWGNELGDDDSHLYLQKIFIAWPMFCDWSHPSLHKLQLHCHGITQHLSVRLSLYPSHMWSMWSPLGPNLAGPLLILYVWLCPMVNCSSLHLSLPFIFLLFSNILAMGPLHQNNLCETHRSPNSMYRSMVFIDDSPNDAVTSEIMTRSNEKAKCMIYNCLFTDLLHAFLCVI